MTTTIEDAVVALGVNVVSSSDREIKGYCPVHPLTMGREDQHPSWYINAHTGAWLCFSCHAAGSLSHLVEMLGGDDVDGVASLVVDVAVKKARSFTAEKEAEPEAKPAPYVSERLFAKHPYPHKAAIERRDLTIDVCKMLNIRWDREGMCYLLPIYDFSSCLLGWQEKSAGYFNNYPPDVKKSRSLFGYQAIARPKILVLVESQLDAARFWRYDFQAVAAAGSALSTAQAEAIAVLQPAVVVIAMDNDKAGDDAAARAAAKLNAHGVKLAYFRYPEDTRDMDPGDLSPKDLSDGVHKARIWPTPEIKEHMEKAERAKWR